MNILRILSYIVLGFSVLFWPWWISVTLLTICLFYFNLYFEGVLIAIFYDTIFSIPTSYFWNIEFVATIFAVIFLASFHVLKKRLFWTQGL